MGHFTQNTFLYEFAKKIIKNGRNLTIHQMNTLLEGKSKAPFNKELYEKIKHLKQSDLNLVKILLIDAIDGALDNFLWMIEQDEQFDLVAYKGDLMVSLREESDGLSVDYWNFVEEFSEYPTAQEMAGYNLFERIEQEKLFSEQHLVELFAENSETARKYFINILNKKEQYEFFKTRIPKIPQDILETLIDMTLSRSSFHKEQCEEIREIMKKK